MDERELSQRLSEAAEAVARPQPDLALIERRSSRARRRGRWGAGVAAAMLVAGAGGVGFGLGQAAGDGERMQAADEAAPPTTIPAVTEATETIPPADQAAPTTAVLAPATTGPIAGSVGEIGTGEIGTGEASTGDSNPGGTSPWTLEATRQFGASRLRVLSRSEPWSTWHDAGDWEPAPWCAYSTLYRITIDGPDLVDVTSVVPPASAPPGSPVAAATAWLGIEEGRAFQVVLVTGEPGTDVSVVWADGATDSAAIEGSVAELVAQAEPSGTQGYALTVGGPTETVTVEQPVAEGHSAEALAGCQPPPPALPEPGPQQPTDPAAEQERLANDFTAMWADLRARETSPHLDDHTGVIEALDAIGAGSLAETAAAAVHQVDEVSFSDAASAWFRYTVVTPTGRFGERYGTATLGSDGWVFPRGVVCHDIGLAGAACEPPAAAIYPPSWYERNSQYGEGH